MKANLPDDSLRDGIGARIKGVESLPGVQINTGRNPIPPRSNMIVLFHVPVYLITASISAHVELLRMVKRRTSTPFSITITVGTLKMLNFWASVPPRN